MEGFLKAYYYYFSVVFQVCSKIEIAELIYLTFVSTNIWY